MEIFYYPAMSRELPSRIMFFQVKSWLPYFDSLSDADHLMRISDMTNFDTIWY